MRRLFAADRLAIENYDKPSKGKTRLVVKPPKPKPERE